MTPFNLVYDRELSTMLDAMLPYECGDDETGAEEITQRAEEARQLAHLQIQEQHDYDARHYNLRHRPVTYNVGDQVSVWSPISRRQLTESLLTRYFGQYTVLRCISDVN